jgi:Nif-specific regulatory protein
MKEHRKTMNFSKQALEILLDYPWPGNIRELQNTMERIVLICPNGTIVPEMLNHVLPFNYQKLYMEDTLSPTKVAEVAHTEQSTNTAEEPTKAPMLTKINIQEIEKESIIQALIDHRGIQTKAAAQLGMTARQIGYKMKKYGIEQ